METMRAVSEWVRMSLWFIWESKWTILPMLMAGGAVAVFIDWLMGWPTEKGRA